jgi:hypothetical protein
VLAVEVRETGRKQRSIRRIDLLLPCGLGANSVINQPDTLPGLRGTHQPKMQSYTIVATT